ncbi:hypothetical protein LAV73_13840 [Lysinibacillus xylanilyticus]|uniref:hypothetical protein n=1 Tax=Lysinibacillus xylanilyticus TaxID=582475 RepID=UPI002B24E16E|nr:hypothetical protein [Lysinibacillus xylanilyticus]MEB2281070.1 hypothetical protein [Lysinibacillus xylanilyticus]
MKKSLLLVPAVAFGIFSGVSDEASAQEFNSDFKGVEVLRQAMAASSPYENARELKNAEYVNRSTNRYSPTHYYKFYYNGGSGGANLLFHSEGNHKMYVLNGNFIQVGTDRDVTVQNLTYGWNYIEVIQTAPGNVPDQPYKLMVGWD